jgi:hypothetical protein
MTSKRYFYIMLAVLVLLLGLIIGATIGGNVLLKKQSEKLISLKSENLSVEQQQTALIQAKKDVERYSEIEKITRSVVPQDKDQAKTVREIVKIAGENRIPIKSISFETSTLGDAKPVTPTPAPAVGSEGGTPAAPATPKQPAVSQVKPVEGIPGVYSLEIQVASAGEVSYQNFLKFLESLEKNRRTAHVSSISIEPSDDGRTLEFNLTLNAYVKP